MANAGSDAEAHSTPTVDPAGADRHRTLVLASAILATAGALISAGYGISRSLSVLWALALDLALAALVAWICVSACRLRRQASLTDVTDESQDSSVPADRPRMGISRWGADPADVERMEAPAGRWDAYHARKLHYVFLALMPTSLVVLLAAHGLATTASIPAIATSPGAGTALAVVCLAASCVWLILARAYAALTEDELPESTSLSLALRDLQWANLLAAAALLWNSVWTTGVCWTARFLFAWVLVVGIEQLVRLLIAWRQQPAEAALAVPALRLVAREAVFARGHSIRRVLETMETRLGVSFRSSWAIRFVRRSIVPGMLLIALILWGLSGLTIVKVDELGVRESFGQLQAAPLPPGLHWKLPWPCGRVLRYPVKRVSTKSIGFVSRPGRQPTFLWSKKHAQEEFALVLGDGSELVAIDCLVYYKIHEDRQRLLDYAYHGQNPEDSLEAYAYRALMEQTCRATLRDVLTANRAQFANRLEEALRQYVKSNRLGIEVVDVALMGLHPPVEAAVDFLDVISARIDAERVQVEALGQKAVTIEDAHRESATLITSAQVEAAQRTGQALGESSQFTAIGQAFAVAPESLRLRLWFEALEEILESKRFVLVDQSVGTGPGGILLDQRGRAEVDDPIPLTRDAGIPDPTDLQRRR